MFRRIGPRGNPAQSDSLVGTVAAAVATNRCFSQTMIPRLGVVSIALVACLASTVSATSEVEIDSQGNLNDAEAGSYENLSSVSGIQQQQKQQKQPECGLWLAPSTIEGAGLGMFAGVDYAKGDELLVGGDSVVVIADLSNHNTNKVHKGTFLWESYTWANFKSSYEAFAEEQTACEGFGAAANSFLPLHNVDLWHPLLTDTGLHRSKDPGAGASTLFHHRKSTARQDIAAGAELYVSYGEEWFKSRPNLASVPLTDDLDTATAVLKKFAALQQTLSRRKPEGSTGTDIASDVWNTFVKETKFQDSRVLQGSFKHGNPDDLHQLQTVFENDVKAARIAASTRSLDWLQEHGTCGDHIVGQPSTLAQAGMGAFATRHLPIGTVVAPLPMIHITNRGRLEMFTLHYDDDGFLVPISDNVIGHQLLLNYCYGHGESTLLLCPYGPMVNYVNHNQTLANVRLQWGHESKGNHVPSLLNETVASIEAANYSAKLAMEFVAIRDIQQGDEIFLDYGDEWEAAWKAHVASWEPAPGAFTYKSAVQMEMDRSSRLRHMEDELDEPTYSDNVQMLCDTSCHWAPTEVADHYANGTLDDFLYFNGADWWPCSVVDSQFDNDTDDYLYTIQLQGPDDFEFERNENDGMNEHELPPNVVIIEHVPREIFRYIDKPGTSDVFLYNAFRHDIRIPDALFPLSWRNAKA